MESKITPEKVLLLPLSMTNNDFSFFRVLMLITIEHQSVFCLCPLFHDEMYAIIINNPNKFNLKMSR